MESSLQQLLTLVTDATNPVEISISAQLIPMYVDNVIMGITISNERQEPVERVRKTLADLSQSIIVNAFYLASENQDRKTSVLNSPQLSEEAQELILDIKANDPSLLELSLYRFGEMDSILILNALSQNETITSITIGTFYRSGPELGDNVVCVLAKILEKNQHVNSIDISDTNTTHIGITAIIASQRLNPRLKFIKIGTSRNSSYVCESHPDLLPNLVHSATSLEELNMESFHIFNRYSLLKLIFDVLPHHKNIKKIDTGFEDYKTQ